MNVPNRFTRGEKEPKEQQCPASILRVSVVDCPCVDIKFKLALGYFRVCGEGGILRGCA